MAEIKNEKIKNEKTEVFSKKQLIKSKRFRDYRDIMAVVLKENEKYTIIECEKKINEFLNKKCERREK